MEVAGLHDSDVLVIGAGPGGLTAAAHLANSGRRVLVIDAGDHVGGHMSAFTHAGDQFDIGLHYTSEAPAQKVLHPLGVEVEFQQFDPSGRFRMLGPDRSFAVPRGMAAYRNRLLEAFPGERGAIEDFLTLVQRLASEQRQIPDAPGLRDLPMLPWRLRGTGALRQVDCGGLSGRGGCVTGAADRAARLDQRQRRHGPVPAVPARRGGVDHRLRGGPVLPTGRVTGHLRRRG